MKENVALLLIDIQKGFDHPSWWGTRNNLDAESNITKLLAAFRTNNKPIFHVQHLSTNPDSPLSPSQTSVEFMKCAKPLPHEPIFQKKVNSAFIGTNLEEELHKHKIEMLVIAGISTDHCVSTTVRMAANLGFSNYLVADATVAFNRIGYDGKEYSAEIVHNLALASLHNEFTTVCSTENILELITKLNLNIANQPSQSSHNLLKIDIPSSSNNQTTNYSKLNNFILFKISNFKTQNITHNDKNITLNVLRRDRSKSF